MNAPTLQGLRDVWQPQPVSYVPQTPAWYVVFAICAAGILWMAIRAWLSWRANRYRREGIKEAETCAIDQLNSILKRCALAAWPRDRVASLYGPAWLRFLDESYAGSGFTTGPGQALADAPYRATASHEDDGLRELVKLWIRTHHVRT